MAVRRQIPFFTDHDVPDSVGAAILAAGHKLTRLREALLRDSPDEVVATACREASLILVTCNYRDFRRIIREQAAVTSRQPDAVCRIELKCWQPRAAERLMQELPFVELEWERYQANTAQPLRIEVGDASTRIARDWLRG